MRLQLVSLLCLLLALAIAATDYKEPEDREVYNAEREALKLQILDQAVKATAYAAVGVYALYATIQDEMEPIKRAWDTLEADWNGRIHNSRNYMWASQYGSGTEVMKITFEYESRVRGSKIWEKRIESHFFTVTPAFQFNSFGLEYKDTVRYVQVADNAAAMGFVKEAGYYPGTVKAFSATCEPDGEILLAKVMGNFLRDASRDDRLSMFALFN